MTRVVNQRSLLWFASRAALIAAYALVASRLSRPDILPPTQDIAEAFGALVGRGIPPPASEETAGEEHHHHHSSDQVETPLQQGVTLQASLAISTARGLFGRAVGLPLGNRMGLVSVLCRRAADGLAPTDILSRSRP